MAEDKRYRLKIRGHGMIKYYCTDGKFWNIRLNINVKPCHFKQKIDAQNTYVKWARLYPSTAREWIPEIEEV
jgi:hypothetical protein